MRNRHNRKEWLAALTLAFVTAAIAAGTLFLAGPLLLKSRHDYTRYAEVDESGWSPLDGVDFQEIDSMTTPASRGFLLIRYGADAPGNVGLSLMNVLPDGSMRGDTLNIMLRDKYGDTLGSRGYGVSEMKIPFRWNVDVSDCRLMEIAPVEEVRGIRTVGLLIENGLNNENHTPSGVKASAI